jgi:mono/diheme cytochrome c family protein
MMRRALFIFSVSMWLAASLVASPAQTVRSPRESPAAAASDPAALYVPILTQYCVTCHNERAKAAELVLEKVDFTNIPARGELWETVVRKLRRGAMPPIGVRRPDATTYEGLITWLETELDRAAAAHPNPGRPLPHRLNRAEYANAIRDLLDLDIGDVGALLPPDDSAYGFDNIADVLGMSSVLLERYVGAAGRISALAVGDTDVAPGSETYSVRQDFSQDQQIEGQPFGTVGGILARHTFPLDAEYELRASLLRTNVDQTRGLEHAHQVEFTIDGERVFLTRIGADPPGEPGAEDEAATRGLSRSDRVDVGLRVRVPVKAGPHTVGVAFLQRALVLNTRRLQPYRSSFDAYDSTGLPHIRTLSVIGPFNATGPGETPSRKRIFVCRPSSPAADGSTPLTVGPERSRTAEEPCATKILSTLARRAYRQPVTETDMQRLMEFYRRGRSEGNFEIGIQRALQRILASPKFVLRVEHDPPNVAPGAAYAINDFELASRISFFLWSSIPDDELLRLAAEGRLRTPAVLAQQVRRMLADRRSEALVANFAGQWLQLRNLRNSIPDNDLFPEFDDNLRQAFARETELLFESVVRENRSAIDLLTADYTFVNERLAKHYEIPYIYGSHFRRVPVTDAGRQGLLGHGSILTLTSNADRTSPVVRGKWILANLLGMPPAPPPPNVPPLKSDVEKVKPTTMREQMEEHRKNPVCAGCHKIMDPLGFAMENFDAVGRWRTRDAGSLIDATGQFIDGTELDGVDSLRQALVKRPDVFVSTMTEKLLIYALGRGLEPYDMPAVRRAVRESARDDYRFSSLILEIVSSTPFQMRTKASTDVRTPAIKTAGR